VKYLSLLLLLAVFLAPFGAAAPEYARMGPDIFDAKIGAEALIAHALTLATPDQKRVLLLFGANWCPWCRRLHAALAQDRAVGARLREHFVLVYIDANTRNDKQRNAKVIERYDNPVQFGLPVFVVLDHQGRQLATRETGSLAAESDAQVAERVLAFLTEWSGAPAPAKWSDLQRKLDARFHGVPTLSTQALADRLRAIDRNPPLLVDVRAREEFDVSHLRGAIWAGTEKAQADLLKRTPPDREIVFYCSVGWRSAQATERALKAGRAGVSNLGGSIFQWANEGRPLMGMDDKTPTTLVHPYDDTWGQMLDRRLWSRRPVS
jgi:rhodanese-related sulfurtransferase/thioredoxin-related protein